jgi:hypothetical protein
VTVPVHRVCLAGLLVPLMLAMTTIAWISVGERAGATPLAGLTPGNSAEAAGMASAAEMLRLLRSGDDPNRVYPVRPEIISSTVLRATTLEAAVWSRQVQLVELLDREGAIVGADVRRATACLAIDVGVEDIAAYLSPDTPPECEDGRELERVLDRTRKINDE